MTDEENLPKVIGSVDSSFDISQKKNKDQEMIESDVESVCSDDKSNVTTDDEFYNELMSAPAEYEDHLILDGCTDEIIGIEHLTTCLNRRYNSCPIVLTGTLKDAIKEALDSKERRPLLIFINNDKSVYSNLFCKQLLCHEKIVEFLLNNYVLWAWDVTFQSNGEKLNEIYKTALLQWNVDQEIGTKSIEQYPLLIGISHARNGDYSFKYLINGSDRRPIVDEFLARLIQFKDQFDDAEEELERFEQDKARQHQMSTVLSTDNFPHSSKHLTDYEFSRLTSMHSNRNLPQFLSGDPNQVLMNPRMFLTNTFQQLTIHPDDDGDDEDDDDDDDGKTPTVNHPAPKFPKK